MPTPFQIAILAWGCLVSAETCRALDPGPIPQWIWTNRDQARGASVELHRRFTLRELPKQASAWMLADDQADLLINGESALEVTGTHRIQPVDITRFLRVGTNELICRALNREGAAGIALALVLRPGQGPANVLVSDPQWWTLEENGEEEPVRSEGLLGNLPWGNPEGESEDYYQWKRALGKSSAQTPAEVAILPGFKIDLVRSSSPGEGSWVSLTFDDRGRIILGREGKGLLRYSPPPVDRIEVINDTLEECRGVLFAGRSLFANANNSRALFRLQDSNDDDQFDEVTLLKQTEGGVGHGRNALALGPDGMVYCIHGNNVRVNFADLSPRSPLRNQAEDQLLPCEWDRFLFDADARVPAGHVTRIDPNGGRWELFAGGFRNPYGLDFNAEGELFTFDADNEGDLGTPWYRPNRIHHIASGGDYGFRQGTANRDRGFPEHPASVVDIGLASPTGVKFGTHSHFPGKYRQALYALDWSYGRIYAIHLIPRGAGYVATVEKFLEGSPLNVTDVAFGPEGAMYFITGGRGTQSGLYRVRAIGTGHTPILVDDEGESPFTADARRLRRQLEAFHSRIDPVGLELAWAWLGSRQPTLQHAARVALESQPPDQWKDRALAESPAGPRGAAAALALARVGRREDQQPLLEHLAKTVFLPDDWRQMSISQRLAVLRAVSVSLSRMGRPELPVCRDWSLRLEPLFLADVRDRWNPDAPLVDQWLAELLVYFDSPHIVSQALAWTETRESPAERLRFLFLLRSARVGWSTGLRRQYFELLQGLEHHSGGNLLPVALDALRNEVLAKLPDDERGAMETLFAAEGDSFADQQRELAARPVVQRWQVSDLDQILRHDHEPDSERGAKLFEQTLCIRCHRVNGAGGSVGPELSRVANRFGPRDLLEMIVDPHKTVDEKYRQTQVETKEGRVVVGRLVGGDDRSLILSPDAFRPRHTTKIHRDEVESQQVSATSPMPTGLLDTLQPKEILDLLAFLRRAKPDTRPK
jgi:putative heme-binding domain-containing protein